MQTQDTIEEQYAGTPHSPEEVHRRFGGKNPSIFSVEM
jgi:hypothetical protein